MSPFHVCIEPVVGSPAFIFFLQALFRCFLALTIFCDDPFGPFLQAGMDKHIQAVSFVPENIIRASPNNNTGRLLSQFCDDPALNGPELILIWTKSPALRAKQPKPSLSEK